MDLEKRIYFLGAGSSTLAGLPTFNNFRDKAVSICLDKSFNPDDKDREIFTKVLEHWRRFYKDYTIEEYYSAIEMSDILSHEITYELEIEEWDISKDRVTPITHHKTYSITVDDVFRVIYKTIGDITGDSIRSRLKNSSPYYKTFLNHIERNKDIIMTTNWDIVLEHFIPKYHIDYINVYSHDLLDKISRIDSFKILKLNGSLNWGYCSECNTIYHFDLIYELESNCKICSSELKRVIVPPTLSKLIYTKDKKDSRTQLIPIWKDAYECLRYCREIYFIGYSFPETDVQMRVFISNALRNNTNLKNITIISDQKYGNSRIEFEERYVQILSKIKGRLRIDFNYDGFKCYCNSLSKDPIDDIC